MFVITRIKNDFEQYEYERQFYQSSDLYIVAVAKWMLSIVVRKIGEVTCRFFGHGKHWSETDWAGPESGGMGGQCDRCGEHFHHILY